jgi:GNAT superfamily N-acetyltransferase
MDDPGAGRVDVFAPQPRHVSGLVQLSARFAEESPWAATISIGRITNEEVAAAKLVGQGVLVARVAETESGRVVGYVGVHRHSDVVDMSVLVHADHRRLGIGRLLVEDAFNALPSGLEVEAWVGAFNEASLAALPRLGFDLARIIEDGGRTVRVFTRAL